MTVRELIAALQSCDPDALVFTEGCDCYDDATEIRSYPGPIPEYICGHLVDINDQKPYVIVS